MALLPTTLYTSWWRFNEPANAVLAIDALTGYELALAGGYTLGTGALVLNGSTGYGAGSGALMSWEANASTHAVFARVQAPGSSGARRCVFSTGYGGIALTFTSTGALEWGNPNNAGQRVTTSAITAGTVDVFASASNGFLRVYVDGVQRAEVSAGFPNAVTGQGLQVGRQLTAGGAGAEYFTGAIYDLAFPAHGTSGHYDPVNYPGPVILVDARTNGYLAVPDVLAGYVDPAGAGNLGSVVEYTFRRGSTTAGTTPKIEALDLLAGNQAFTVAANADGSQSFAVARSDNNRAFRIHAQLTSGADTWDVFVPVYVQWAIARFNPNVDLGNQVAGLADAWAQPTLKIPDPALILFRAATAAGLTAYASGSAWKSTAAAVMAEGLLPTTGAYLAIQAQINRRTYGA